MTQRTEFLVLGGGLAGLTAAGALDAPSVVLERGDRPGGLARTERDGDYWFDHSVHLLHFADPTVEAMVRGLLGDSLASCPPEARVVTRAGETKYPIQFHLGQLDAEVAIDCLLDVARAGTVPTTISRDFGEWLLSSFGNALCDLFFFPYNRKLYKHPLETLAPVGFQWNIARPDLRSALRGALGGAAGTPYNARGWYPRPPVDAPQRGIESLASALAQRVRDLRLGHQVTRVDLRRREVTVSRGGAVESFRFETACCATLPLDRLVALCPDVPDDIRRDCDRFRHARVLSVAVHLRGTPRDDGVHWRYFPEEGLVFHRLVYPRSFDPLLSPRDGWSVVAEITEAGDSLQATERELVERTVRGLHAVGEIPPDAQIVGTRVIRLDAGYVVFGLRDEPVVERVRAFFEERGVWTVGRYARWEYSSMAQVMGDALQWASRWTAGHAD
jgi:protoporphyrinogen oxidase